MKLTVLVVTCNHERFIAAALDGALRQRVAAEWEIVVSEDCSTDRTREIVVGYRDRYPDRMRLILSERNLRSNEVVARGLRAARGDYVALLDGDDCWLSPEKLQWQVDFLDRNPGCALCFHNAEVVHEDGSRPPWRWTPPGQKAFSSFADLWQGNVIATSAAMFRKFLIREIPDWYLPLFPITDWPLYLLLARHGTVGYIDEVMSVYRFHSGGLYSSLSEAAKIEATSRFYRTMNANLDYACDGMVRAAHARYLFGWAEEYARRGKRRAAVSCAGRSIIAGGLAGMPRPGGLLRLALRVCTPGAVHRPLRRYGRRLLSSLARG